MPLSTSHMLVIQFCSFVQCGWYLGNKTGILLCSSRCNYIDW